MAGKNLAKVISISFGVFLPVLPYFFTSFSMSNILLLHFNSTKEIRVETIASNQSDVNFKGKVASACYK